MKKLLIILGLLLLPVIAHAQIPVRISPPVVTYNCTGPTTLTNNSTADSSQIISIGNASRLILLIKWYPSAASVAIGLGVTVKYHTTCSNSVSQDTSNTYVWAPMIAGPSPTVSVAKDSSYNYTGRGSVGDGTHPGSTEQAIWLTSTQAVNGWPVNTVAVPLIFPSGTQPSGCISIRIRQWYSSLVTTSNIISTKLLVIG